MPSSNVSSLATSTRSLSCFTLRNTCLHILKPPSLLIAYLVRYLLYKLNIIGDKQHPCLTPPPNFTFLVSPWAHHAIRPWFMYNFLINLLSCQSIPVHFGTYINLVLFCQSMRQAHFIICVQSSSWCYSQNPTCTTQFLFLFWIQTDLLQIHPQFSCPTFF